MARSTSTRSPLSMARAVLAGAALLLRSDHEEQAVIYLRAARSWLESAPRRITWRRLAGRLRSLAGRLERLDPRLVLDGFPASCRRKRGSG